MDYLHIPNLIFNDKLIFNENQNELIEHESKIISEDKKSNQNKIIKLASYCDSQKTEILEEM